MRPSSNLLEVVVAKLRLNEKAKGFLTKSLESRQKRRMLKAELKADLDNAFGVKEEKDQQERAIAIVTEMLKERGVRFVEDFPLQFREPRSHDGVMMRLRRLVYSKKDDKDPVLPWANNLDLERIKAMLRRCVAPHWAIDLKKQTINSISVPSTTGMLKDDMSPNKDLKQLLVNAQSVDLTGIEVHFERAMERLIGEFLNFRVKSSETILHERLDNGKVRLRAWSIKEFRQQMTNALNSSTPGYPLNGMEWDTDLGDRTAFEEVYELGMRRVRDENRDGFLFIQSSRYTGDGSSDEGDLDAEGQQRLVQMAEAAEKLIGHILAEPLKAFIKAPPTSGQRGIQVATRHLKEIAQGLRKCSLHDLPIVAWISTDVGQWDTAQINELANKCFFRFLEEILDLDDEATVRILTNYQEGYMERVLLTAMGTIVPDMLPSGASVTTVMAFIHHLCILYTLDEIVKAQTGKYLFCEIGLQGDDQVAAVSQWDESIERLFIDTYKRFNCRVKGDGFRLRWQNDPYVSVVFLNEAILLKDMNEPNYKFPRWNLFFAETFDELNRGVNIDRLLLAEIKEQNIHPSPRELLMVSFCSKFDRFFGLPFYDFLLKKLIGNCPFELRSWLGTRVLKKSETLRYLEKLEADKGIEYPGDCQANIDRQMESWYHSKELGHLAAIFWLCAQDPQGKPVVRELMKAAKSNNRAWRRAGRAVGVVLTEEDKEAKPLEEFKQMLLKAFDEGYKEMGEALARERKRYEDIPDTVIDLVDNLANSDEVRDHEPVFQRTLSRGILSLNSFDPFTLTKYAAKAVASVLQSPTFEDWPEEHRNLLMDSYREIFQNSDPTPQLEGGQDD